MQVGWKQVTVGNCTNDEKQYVLLLSMMNFDESSIDAIHPPCSRSLIEWSPTR